MTADIGILLTNVGSPNQPTPASVKKYLKKFLSDPRIVELPRFIWQPILHGFILQTRPKKSAHLYQQIWTEQGSPLLCHSQQIAEQLSTQCQMPVELGTHYGDPSIAVALEKLRAQQVKKILILPLYPQYSATTTAVTFDQVAAVLKTWREIPEIRTIHNYATDENYIHALCQSIQNNPIEHLVFSFHGIPQNCIEKGDPYLQQCQKTVSLITEKLQLPPEKWTLAFQSRLGYAKWITPYTSDVLQELPQKNIKNIHVICPGFAVDCLETLEEIAIRGKKQFLEAGGKSFQYIPALNSNKDHITTLTQLIKKYSSSW